MWAQHRRQVWEQKQPLEAYRLWEKRCTTPRKMALGSAPITLLNSQCLLKGGLQSKLEAYRYPTGNKSQLSDQERLNIEKRPPSSRNSVENEMIWTLRSSIHSIFHCTDFIATVFVAMKSMPHGNEDLNDMYTLESLRQVVSTCLKVVSLSMGALPWLLLLFLTANLLKHKLWIVAIHADDDNNSFVTTYHETLSSVCNDHIT